MLGSFEGLPSLSLAEVEAPKALRGEVVLKVRYAALNPADRYLAEGRYPAKPALPHILGRDGVGEADGEVRAILRSEIGVNRWGTFAEFVAVAEQSLVNIPEGWSEEEMAGAPLVYLTAYQALTQWGELPSGPVVLVTGASGGVGVASVQLAKAMGHAVVALSRSKEKGERLKELGADVVVDPSERGWAEDVKRRIAPRRVELAIDNVAGPMFGDVIATLGDRGKVSLVGREAGAVPEFNTGTLFFKRLRIGGVAVGAYTAEESQVAWGEVVKWMDRSGARPVVDSVFEFEKLPQAFERLKQGPMGKVLLRVGA
jgi:NADPH2:quinone reductase